MKITAAAASIDNTNAINISIAICQSMQMTATTRFLLIIALPIIDQTRMGKHRKGIDAITQIPLKSTMNIFTNSALMPTKFTVHTVLLTVATVKVCDDHDRNEWNK